MSEEDLGYLTARAERLHGGNLSAVVHELVEWEKRNDAADKFLATYGKDVIITEADMQAIRDEWAAPPARPPKRKRARAKATRAA